MTSLNNLIPSPIRNVVMAPIAARGNAELAANRLIRSSIRIVISTVGIFASYKLFGMLASSFAGTMTALFFPLAVVYISSMPAGNIMYGSVFLGGGYVGLVTTLALEALTLYSIGLNLVTSAFYIGIMGIGLFCIDTGNESTSLGNFSGYLEPCIINIAQRYQIPVAGFLRMF